MKVSEIASDIYQSAKLNCYGVWNWRKEWAKAMKAAWRQVSRKLAWIAQEERRVKIAFPKKETKERSASKKSITQQIAEAAFAEDERFKKMGLFVRAW